MLQYRRETAMVQREFERDMLKKILVASMFVLAATPALAFGGCTEPYGPVIPDGNSATEEQLKHSLSDVKQFIKDSDEYQTCIANEVNRQADEARRSKDKKPLDPSVKAEADALIAKNQQLKQRVGDEFNTAANAYNAKHPKTP